MSHKRTRLPADRSSLTHTVTIGGKTVLTFCIGLYPDGRPGELFGLEVECNDENSLDDTSPALMGLLDAWATDVSLLLQTGYSVQDLCRKHIDTCFEPRGFTDNPEIRSCQSIVDYIMKYMFKHYHTEDK